MHLHFLALSWPFLLFALGVGAAHSSPSLYDFRPQEGGVGSAGLTSYPVPYNLSTSQTNRKVSSSGGSFWSSTFVHAANGHDYMIVSNTIADVLGSTLYRFSILDITEPTQFSQFTSLTNVSNIYSSSGVFNATFDRYGFGSTSSIDPLSEMRTYSSIPGSEFDIVFETSSPVLLNGGAGMFWVAGGLALQWSMPAGKTRGWIGVQGKKVSIISERSSTWYDRQWGSSSESITWFGVQLPGRHADGSDHVIFSIWTWHDPINGDKAFATTRTGYSAEQKVVPVSWKVSSNRTFSSPKTGVSWPLDWTLTVHGGPELNVSSVRPDQEAHGDGVPLKAYSGFLNVVARYQGKKEVYGFAVTDNIRV